MQNNKEVQGRGNNSGLEVKMPGQWSQFNCSLQGKNPQGKERTSRVNGTDASIVLCAAQY